MNTVYFKREVSSSRLFYEISQIVQKKGTRQLTQNKNENTVVQDKYLEKVNNFLVSEIRRAIDKLDADTKTLLYSHYKMGEIWYLMNYNREFCRYIKELMENLKDYEKIADGLSKMKDCLDKGEVSYTDEEIADSFIKGYGSVSEDMQDAIREKLGLARRDDIPEQKEEPVK